MMSTCMCMCIYCVDVELMNSAMHHAQCVWIIICIYLTSVKAYNIMCEEVASRLSDFQTHCVKYDYIHRI